MEQDCIVHDTHTRCITAIGFSSQRREIYLGFEDGCVKSIEIENAALVNTYFEHKGWITDFLFWPTAKILFCSSNDSCITAIGPGGNKVDKMFVGMPIYTMVLNNRRKEVIFGVANGLQFHPLNETKESNFAHYIDVKPNSIISEHTDIVRSIVVLDSRIYSAGYDGALVIYDCQYTGRESAVKFYKNAHAHDAGISCLQVEKDVLENNVWVFTGGFDKTLKIWTGDGKIVHKFDGFITGITGLCYVPKNKTICCAAGTKTAFIYDPKSGEDVTDFIDTFENSSNTHTNYYLQLLKYVGEPFNLLLATTSRKQLIIYKYNPTGCITSLKYKHTLDSICHTTKVPILIFTGDSNGLVLKWEQRQSNQLIYGSETLLKSDAIIKESAKVLGPPPQSARPPQQEKQLTFIQPKSNTTTTNYNNTIPKSQQLRMRATTSSISNRNNKIKSAPANMIHSRHLNQDLIKKMPKIESPVSSMNRTHDTEHNDLNRIKKTNVVLKMIFVEALDIMCAACEDGSIYVWGFDEDAVKVLKDMRFSTEEKSKQDESNFKYYNAYLKTLQTASGGVEDLENTLNDIEDTETATTATTTRSAAFEENNKVDSVTNRVAGLILKKVLNEHKNSVTCLCLVERLDMFPLRYMLSSGWDRRICIWSMDPEHPTEQEKKDQKEPREQKPRILLVDVFKNKLANTLEESEYASDGHILDIDYCSKHNYYAYSSSDSMVYIRKFAMHGSEMTLVYTLQGHLSDVNCVRWMPSKLEWITGGEDGTVRVWGDDFVCHSIINCHGAVNSLCMDLNENILIVAAHDMVKCYEMDEYHLVQTNSGHHDSIRDVMLIPERNHIVSVSWDRTIKIWKSYRKQKLTRNKLENNSGANKFETWVWDAMKAALTDSNQIKQEKCDKALADQLMLKYQHILS